MTLRDALLRGKRRPPRFGAGSPTTYRGDGYEFVELREYIAGDDVRRIDWAASARVGALQTRVVLEDVALTIAVAVDDSPSMRVGRNRALLDAAREAERAWFSVTRAGDRRVTVPYDGAFALRDVLAAAQAVLPRGAALLVISDWYDVRRDDEDALARLASRCDCTALVARDPWFDGLPLAGFVRLRGAEGGAVRTFIGRRERESYVRAVEEREANVVRMLEAFGWRAGALEEADGAASLYRAFGLEHGAR